MASIKQKNAQMGFINHRTTPPGLAAGDAEPLKKTLPVRIHRGPGCGLEFDRDVKGTTNLLTAAPGEITANGMALSTAWVEHAQLTLVEIGVRPVRLRSGPRGG